MEAFSFAQRTHESYMERKKKIYIYVFIKMCVLLLKAIKNINKNAPTQSTTEKRTIDEHERKKEKIYNKWNLERRKIAVFGAKIEAERENEQKKKIMDNKSFFSCCTK